jgi:hypothetical protein
MDSRGPLTEALESLRLAVERGTPRDVDAWATCGLYGLRVLRDVLAGAKAAPWKDVHSRDASDALMVAVAAIAAAHPADFLDVFSDPVRDEDPFVLVGLGYVRDERATNRLIRAAKSATWANRMDAARGLGRQKSPLALPALVLLLGDSEYLIRYHALKGLAEVGDDTVIAALGDFVAPTRVEGQLAEAALAAIRSRSVDKESYAQIDPFGTRDRTDGKP